MFIQKYEAQICDVISCTLNDFECTLQNILELPESNERLMKQKELKNAFSNPNQEELEIDIFKNMNSHENLKKFEEDFNLNDLKKINYEEDYEVNNI